MCLITIFKKELLDLSLENEEMSKRFRPKVRNPVEYESETDEENEHVGEVSTVEACVDGKRVIPVLSKSSVVQNRVSEGHAAMAHLMNNSLSSSTITEYKVCIKTFFFFFFLNMK